MPVTPKPLLQRMFLQILSFTVSTVIYFDKFQAFHDVKNVPKDEGKT